MSIFSRDDDDDLFEEANRDCSMFTRMDREEFQRKLDRAKEISSGEFLGTFERDEDVWELVRKLEDKK